MHLRILEDIIKKREAEWRSVVAPEGGKNGLEYALRKVTREIEDDREEKAPSDYLRDAYLMLSKITIQHMENPEFINNEDNLDLARKINKISWDIKKSME
jgi:hypothetical protein